MKYPIEVEISDYCNLGCQCCPNKGFKQRGNITEKDFYRICGYIYDNLDDISFLDLCGIGDIFLHPKINVFLIYLAEKFKDKELKVLMPSKGISVNDENIRILKSIKEKGLDFNITIGIYSLRKEVHDKITGLDGSLKMTFDFIRKLKKNDLPFSLELMINHFSIDEVSHFKDISTSLGVNCKVHNYHNFSGAVKLDGLFKNNKKSNKVQCSFADEEDFNLNLYCKNPLPLFSRDGEVFACTHGGKHERYLVGHHKDLFIRFPKYADLLDFIFKNKLNEELCRDCTYLTMPL